MSAHDPLPQRHGHRAPARTGISQQAQVRPRPLVLGVWRIAANERSARCAHAQGERQVTSGRSSLPGGGWPEWLRAPARGTDQFARRTRDGLHAEGQDLDGQKRPVWIVGHPVHEALIALTRPPPTRRRGSRHAHHYDGMDREPIGYHQF